AVYGVLALVLGLLFIRLPSSFFPEEDQGFFITLVQLPPGASADRTRAVIDQVATYYRTQERDTVESVFAVDGFGFAGVGQNQGVMWIELKDWSQRPAARQRASAIVGRAFGALSG